MVFVSDVEKSTLQALAKRYHFKVQFLTSGTPIPHSFWGDDEAGINGDTLYIRPNTPVHSFLHELGHAVCAKAAGRPPIKTDAFSDDLEECAVCYLQILWADHIAGFSKAQALQDMNNWGYSFRLGSSQRWFEEDASDARDWLIQQKLLTNHALGAGQT